MTDPTQPTPAGEPVDEPVDEQVDTTDGSRDPLSTDDGLAEAAAAGMPEVEQRDTPPGEDAGPTEERRLLDAPGLEVGDDGEDPCADLGRCDADAGD